MAPLLRIIWQGTVPEHDLFGLKEKNLPQNGHLSWPVRSLWSRLLVNGLNPLLISYTVHVKNDFDRALCLWCRQGLSVYVASTALLSGLILFLDNLDIDGRPIWFLLQFLLDPHLLLYILDSNWSDRLFFLLLVLLYLRQFADLFLLCYRLLVWAWFLYLLLDAMGIFLVGCFGRERLSGSVFVGKLVLSLFFDWDLNDRHIDARNFILLLLPRCQFLRRWRAIDGSDFAIFLCDDNPLRGGYVRLISYRLCAVFAQWNRRFPTIQRLPSLWGRRCNDLFFRRRLLRFGLFALLSDPGWVGLRRVLHRRFSSLSYVRGE